MIRWVAGILLYSRAHSIVSFVCFQTRIDTWQPCSVNPYPTPIPLLDPANSPLAFCDYLSIHSVCPALQACLLMKEFLQRLWLPLYSISNFCSVLCMGQLHGAPSPARGLLQILYILVLVLLDWLSLFISAHVSTAHPAWFACERAKKWASSG